MKTINLTIRLTAFKGELKGDNWVNVLVGHIVKQNNVFAEKTVQINAEEYDSFIKDYLFETIKKDLCVYIEIQMNGVTTAIMAANGQEDYYIHTLVDEY